jgi:hypothetical protein
MQIDLYVREVTKIWNTESESVIQKLQKINSIFRLAYDSAI